MTDKVFSEVAKPKEKELAKEKELQKEKDKEHGKPEKDVKDHKEQKDHKENKDHKDSKDQKDQKDKDKDKDKDGKDHKDQKDQKDHKNESKEKHEKEKVEKEHKDHKETAKEPKEHKEPKEQLKEIEQPSKPLFEGGPPMGGADPAIAQRLAALEATMAQLLHFIPANMRPDLATGALAQESDADKTSAPKSRARAIAICRAPTKQIRKSKSERVRSDRVGPPSYRRSNIMHLFLCTSSDYSARWAFRELLAFGLDSLELVTSEMLALSTGWEHSARRRRRDYAVRPSRRPARCEQRGSRRFESTARSARNAGRPSGRERPRIRSAGADRALPKLVVRDRSAGDQPADTTGARGPLAARDGMGAGGSSRRLGR